MARKNLAIALLASISLVIPAQVSTAQPGKEKKAGKERGKGHNHKQMNGHNLLGAKLKQNGKHVIGKLANRDLTVDVKNGKVAGMGAGDLPMKRVKTKQKMAMIDNAIIPVAWTGLKFVQYGGGDYYYGYCFDDGIDYTCYWYPADDVDYADYTWDDYDPYY